MVSTVSRLIDSAIQSPFRIGLLLCVLLILSIRIARFYSDRQRNPRRLPFPPGPKGYPLIGSVLEMPTSYQWLKYTEWAKVYGDVFSFEALGQRIIVLNTLKATQEIFESRSSNYSDRPRMPMVSELSHFDFIFGMLPYGSSWRRHRRSFNEHYRASVAWKHHPIQSRGAKVFLNRLLQTPEMLMSHIREALASTILNIAYGIKISGLNDPYAVIIEESAIGLSAAALTGTFLVDLIPALKYVPSWFPGAGFKKQAAHWKEVNRKVVELPFNHVARQIIEGTATESVAATLITALPEGDEKLLAEETKIAQNVAAVALLGGADTTLSAMQTFFLAMAKYPEVQKKAQAELDAVIGPHRLPEFGDRPSLPYISALVKETLRWQQVSPLAVAHMATEDDVYEGYFIPKGSVVFGNTWAILHDERIFAEPEEFRPEHFLKSERLNLNLRQPEVSAFGYGRRVCPGRFVADNSLFSFIASTLHCFNITPALDENGMPIPLSTEMTSGMISFPIPFKVDVKPRTPTTEALIKDAVLEDP